jgi:uncharacterized protein
MKKRVKLTFPKRSVHMPITYRLAKDFNIAANIIRAQVAPNMVQLNNGITLFFSLLVEAMPFLLLGVIFSSVLLLFVDEQKLLTLIPKNVVLAALAGGLIGFMFPVCECGNIPVARRLLMKGAPTAVAIGFLLAAPTVNPIVFWATWIAFRDQPEIVFLRVGFTLIVAMTIALIFSAQADMRPFYRTIWPA